MAKRNPVYLKAFSERLRYVVKLRKISQVELSRATKATPAAVSRWMSGEHLPDVETIPHLADFLVVKPEYLLRGAAQEEAGPGQSIVLQDGSKWPSLAELLPQLDRDQREEWIGANAEIGNNSILPAFVDVRTAGRLMELSERSMRKLIERDQIPFVLAGEPPVRLIRVVDIERWARLLPSGGPSLAELRRDKEHQKAAAESKVEVEPIPIPSPEQTARNLRRRAKRRASK